MTSAIMTALGIAALHAREGVRLKAYLDTQGVWTIGYGHTKGVKKGDRITQAQADAFFLDDLASHALPILTAIKVSVADHERDALISIAFNIGVNGFRRSTFLKRLNAGDRAGCAAAIMMWTKNKELISRRTAERDQFLTPYRVRAPKARSTDARPVTVPISAQTPQEVPLTIDVPPSAGPVFAPAARNGGAPTLPAPLPPLASPTSPARSSLGNRIAAWLMKPWTG